MKQSRLGEGSNEMCLKLWKKSKRGGESAPKSKKSTDIGEIYATFGTYKAYI